MITPLEQFFQVTLTIQHLTTQLEIRKGVSRRYLDRRSSMILTRCATGIVTNWARLHLFCIILAKQASKIDIRAAIYE